MNNARKPRTASAYKTFWMINGKRIDSEHTMTQKVLAGAIAVEVSAERQQAEAEQRERQQRAAVAGQDRLYKAAMQLQYENSPEGQRAAAMRSAAENPGGIVTFAESNKNFSDLDAFGRDKTNLLQ